MFAKLFGFGFHLAGTALIAQAAGDRGGGAPSAVDISLDLDECDRPPRQRSVSVENGVAAVLPALVHQTFGVAPAVFHEAIAVTVALALDPLQRGFDIRPDGADLIEIARALQIGACEHDEKRRGIDAAVIMMERYFAQDGHLALTDLMQNLAR